MRLITRSEIKAYDYKELGKDPLLRRVENQSRWVMRAVPNRSMHLRMRIASALRQEVLQFVYGDSLDV